MNTVEGEVHKARKKPPRPKRNPIATAINSWFEKHAVQLNHQHDVSDLIAQAPKRWTAYGSLALLPAGSFTSAAWREVLSLTANQMPLSLGPDKDKAEREDAGPALLWTTILASISGSGAAKLTHLAVNEGIPLQLRSKDGGGGGGAGENMLRSPSGLRMLYGDFGPGEEGEGEGGKERGQTGDADFARAFWVSTKQNGIAQTWAPRWTMFSRGNVKEKARLLRFHDGPGEGRDENIGSESEDLRHRHIPRQDRPRAVAVDLYAGIGYFAFSYAAAGFRVFCWELNPWSVEGLRRGAGANGWSVRVVVPPNPHIETSQKEEDEDKMLGDILAGYETIVVFLEDNARAAARLRRLDRLSRGWDSEQQRERGPGFRISNVMHVNLGLLPSSQMAWPTAWEVARESRLAWFHVHENVGVADIDARRGEIRGWFAERSVLGDEGGVRTGVCVEHVELVKTFAPGVWHCVFDLCVRREGDRGDGIT
ncbi:hypothetical protein F4859DRAFT_505572 [Xylaria cf. heliscus]|nr:hypothetical protein F4859DRAFT_505572 [Xylaria cf. heliscus]